MIVGAEAGGVFVEPALREEGVGGGEVCGGVEGGFLGDAGSVLCRSQVSLGENKNPRKLSGGLMEEEGEG